MKCKLIYLEWEDALHRQDGWCSLEQALEWGKKASMIIKETGYLLEENDRHILLAGRQTVNSRYDEERDQTIHYGSIFKIPKTWIRKRKILKI